MELNQDLSQVEAQSFEPLPPGQYHVQVTDSAVVQAKSGSTMLKLTLTVAGPDCHGRKLFEHFVLGNSVAMSRLKSLAIAGRHHTPDFIRDSDELHGLELLVTVKLEEDKTGQYSPKNRITSFRGLGEAGGGVTPMPAQLSAPLPAQHPAAPAPRPMAPVAPAMPQPRPVMPQVAPVQQPPMPPAAHPMIAPATTPAHPQPALSFQMPQPASQAVTPSAVAPAAPAAPAAKTAPWE